MSAECGKCGHDLDYYGGCAVCANRERAEQAEAERDEWKAKFEAELLRKLDSMESMAAQRDALAEALRELVRLKDLKDADRDLEWTDEEKLAAWQTARSALAALEPKPDSEPLDREEG